MLTGRAYRIRVHRADGSKVVLGFSLGLRWYVNDFDALVVVATQQWQYDRAVLKTFAKGTVTHVEPL